MATQNQNPLGGGPPAKSNDGEKAPTPPAELPKWYEVTKGGNLPVKGGMAVVNLGEQFMTGSYDLVGLARAGIEIKECPAPRWFVDAQAKSMPSQNQPGPPPVGQARRG